MIFTRILPLLACVTAALAKPTPAPVKGPLKLTGRFDAVHDPSVAQKPDGSYIVVSTSPQGMEIRTSPDKLNWTYEGNIFPTPPAGVGAFNNNTNDLWAPDIHRKGDTYHLYWSASSFGKQDSGIFYATSKTGAPGSFEQKGLVISSKAGSPYNAIDPFWVKDGSRQYLSFGSFWTGLWQIELNPKTGKVLDGAEPVHLSQRDISVEGAVEAPSVFKKGNAWFLVESWDKCCSGTKSTYNTRVVRSTSGVNGPYYDKDGVPALQGGGTLLLASEGAIIGPGGGSVYKDTDGSYYLYHHWYSDTTSSLGIRKLDFSSGWPVVM